MNFIIKVTRQCNLDCSYCYEKPFHGDPARFTVPKIEQVFSRLLNYYRRQRGRTFLHFVWHGGEPTIIPASFYWKALDLQDRMFSKRKFIVKNDIQTNLVHLTDEYIELFKTGRFSLGVSFDVANENRRLKNGAPSEELVLRNMELLRSHRIRHGSICVITRQNIRRIDAIYRFFADRNISIQVLPVCHMTSASFRKYGVTPAAYAKAMIKLFDLWFYDKDADMMISDFASMIAGLTDTVDGRRICMLCPNCVEDVMHIGPDGTAYACDRMDREPFIYGNIFRESFSDIMNSPARRFLLSRTEQIAKECGGCRYYRHCFGGCMNMGMLDHDYMKKSAMCAYYKTLLTHIEKRLKQHDLIDKRGHLRKDHEKRLQHLIPPRGAYRPA